MDLGLPMWAIALSFAPTRDRSWSTSSQNLRDSSFPNYSSIQESDTSGLLHPTSPEDGHGRVNLKQKASDRRSRLGFDREGAVQVCLDLFLSFHDDQLPWFRIFVSIVCF